MNKLGKHIFVILILSSISCVVFAQGMRMQQLRRESFRQGPNNRANRMQNPGMRRIQVVKEDFIGHQLSLSKEEGEKFWPIYRQYQNELFEVRRLKRLNNSAAQANGSEQIKKDLDYDSQLVDIRKRYNDEFLKILPPEKVSELYKSERQFTDELIKQVHEQNNKSTQ